MSVTTEARPKKIFDTEAFFTYIDARVKTRIGLMETIIDFCDKHEVDLLLAAEVIKRHSKYKKLLAEEASNLYMIK